jgi:ABC-type phosphate transport system auxiliary subunit
MSQGIGFALGADLQEVVDFHKAIVAEGGKALVGIVNFRPQVGTVKLKETRLTDPQDDGLESSREPAMLGVGQRDSAQLDNTL